MCLLLCAHGIRCNFSSFYLWYMVFFCLIRATLYSCGEHFLRSYLIRCTRCMKHLLHTWALVLFFSGFLCFLPRSTFQRFNLCRRYFSRLRIAFYRFYIVHHRILRWFLFLFFLFCLVSRFLACFGVCWSTQTFNLHLKMTNRFFI